MRFCPFCSAETPEDASQCGTCTRRLPPLPPRRRKPARSVGIEPKRPIQSLQRHAPDQEEAGEIGDERAVAAPVAEHVAVAVAVSVTETATVTEAATATEAESESVTVTVTEAAAISATEAAATSATEAAATSATETEAAAAFTGAASAPAMAYEPVYTHAHAPTPAYAQAPVPAHVPAPAYAQLAPQDSFTPPAVSPLPEIPDANLLNAMRYALAFTRARWQRSAAIKALTAEITRNTATLDTVLGAVGQTARTLKLHDQVLAQENAALDRAELRRAEIEHALDLLSNEQAAENSQFGEIESERLAKVGDADAALADAEKELDSIETELRSLRDRRRGVERQQRNYLKTADDREAQAAKAPMGEERAKLRNAAEDMRVSAAALAPELDEIERRESELQRPLARAMATVEALKGELDVARVSLSDAREGHRDRLAEIAAQQSKRSRELAQAEAEMERHLITLGTLVNLHRIDRAELHPLYERIDALRGAVGAHTADMDRLTAEREAYDKRSLVRGYATFGGAVLGVILFFAIVASLF